MTKTVTPVVVIKVSVATIERGDSRAIPHTPCPEVQPAPKVTPIPTISPPITSIGVEIGTCTTGICPVTASTTTGPLIMPSSIATRQAQSALSAGVKSPARMPVAPITRPIVAINKTAASPIKAPPPSDCSGVKTVSILTACRSGCPTRGRAGKTSSQMWQSERSPRQPQHLWPPPTETGPRRLETERQAGSIPPQCALRGPPSQHWFQISMPSHGSPDQS
mmetsp:Transcript_24440/g.45516  ORF Transcript_24440/g.45516 Transcript_24440/m.45516 type:complete len:221 (-) Transcript_24440:1265-1927(-)